MICFTLAMLIITCTTAYADESFCIAKCNNLISQRMLTVATRRLSFSTTRPTTPAYSESLETKDGLTHITHDTTMVTIGQGEYTRSFPIPQWHRITRIWTEDCQTLGLVLKDERNTISSRSYRFCYRLDLEHLTSKQQTLCKKAFTAWENHRAYMLEAPDDKDVYATLPAIFQHRALFKKEDALVSQPQPDTRALLPFTAIKAVVSYLIGL